MNTGNLQVIGLLWHLTGYVNAKIEDCRKREPPTMELLAWEDMKIYLDKIIKELQEK